MQNKQKYADDDKFEENILVVRKTGCEKRTLVQKLAVNNFLGDFQIVEWE